MSDHWGLGGAAVITGAGAGLGAAFAREAARLGMTVIVSDVSIDRANAVAADIVARGGVAEPAQVDVRDERALSSLARTVHDRHGGTRLLINNAAIEAFGLSWELSTEQWRRTVDINILGVANGVRAFMPLMLERAAGGGRGAIANVSAIGAFMCSPMMSPYTMSKHAVLAMTEVLMLEAEALNLPIDVSVIIPCNVSTQIFDDALMADDSSAWAEAYRRRLMERARESMDPDEAARLVFTQLQQRRYWVSTHPEETERRAAERGAFFQSLSQPQTPPDIHGRLMELKPGAPAAVSAGVN